MHLTLFVPILLVRVLSANSWRKHAKFATAAHLLLKIKRIFRFLKPSYATLAYLRNFFYLRNSEFDLIYPSLFDWWNTPFFNICRYLSSSGFLTISFSNKSHTTAWRLIRCAIEIWKFSSTKRKWHTPLFEFLYLQAPIGEIWSL